jgi:hypothetical protein
VDLATHQGEKEPRRVGKGTGSDAQPKRKALSSTRAAWPRGGGDLQRGSFNPNWVTPYSLSLTGAFGLGVHHEFFVTDFAGISLTSRTGFLPTATSSRTTAPLSTEAVFSRRSFLEAGAGSPGLAHGAAGLRFSTDGTALNHELLAGNRALPCSSNAL